MVFTVASEDYNLYAFDMRKLDRPVNVQMDHTGAVIDLDYSPTGRELVSGSYDKTVRIWTTDSGRSREVYHTKRMQRLTAVAWKLAAAAAGMSAAVEGSRVAGKDTRAAGVRKRALG